MSDVKETLIISAFPACGKSHYTEHNKSNHNIILDSDFKLFNKKYRNNIRLQELNPDFPNNYIQHIKDNIGKADIIFVSSHESVRKAMTDNGISYVTIYPKPSLKDEWYVRMRVRGNTEEFIRDIMKNWNTLVGTVDQDECIDEYFNAFSIQYKGLCMYQLKAREYIDTEIIESLRSHLHQ